MKLIDLTENLAIVKQEYSQTVATYKYTLMESRIFFATTYLAQMYEKGCIDAEEARLFGHVEKNSNGEYNVFLRPSSLMGINGQGNMKSWNLQRAREALESFADKPIFRKNDKNQFVKVYPASMTIIRDDENEGMMAMVISPTSWLFITRIAQQYTKVDLKFVMGLSTAAGLRLYQILMSMGPECDALKFSKEELMTMFEVPESKRNNTNYLVTHYLEPAMKDLDENGPVSFSYHMVDKQTGTGRPSYKNVLIKKKHLNDIEQAEHDLRRRIKNEGLASVFNWAQLKEMLKYFTEDELNANAALFMQLKEMQVNVVKETQKLAKKAEGKQNPKGWIITMLKTLTF